MFEKRNYNRSNKITEIDFKVSKKSCLIAKKILLSRSTARRQILSTALCNALSEESGIRKCEIKISSERQQHKKVKGKTVYKLYGFYRPSTRNIVVHNKTAVRGQTLAGKTFLNTVLHEWMHHYDMCKLKLNSIHTKGFYLRLKMLQDILRG